MEQPPPQQRGLGRLGPLVRLQKKRRLGQQRLQEEQRLERAVRLQKGRLAVQQVVPLGAEPLLLVESELERRLQKSRLLANLERLEPRLEALELDPRQRGVSGLD